jgi:dTDP-4-amino-4,6-dideoxygalactose transaminase
VSRRIVSLPLYPTLRDDQVDRVCQAIADVRQRRQAKRAVRTKKDPVR